MTGPFTVERTLSYTYPDWETLKTDMAGWTMETPATWRKGMTMRTRRIDILGPPEEES